jgi:hypothetical protein
MIFFGRKPRLVILHEGRKQISQNCFIAQLYKVLKRNFSVRAIPASRLGRLDGSEFGPGDKVLCLLKQRGWERALPALQRVAARADLYMYDQDPWEAYHDHASSPGIYSKLAASVRIRAFLVTSGWWADYIAKTDRLPVRFVRMSLLPEWCNAGPDYLDRPHEVGFQGTVHAHRRQFFDRIKELGHDVALLPSVPYRKFLKTVQSIRIFLHDERADVCVNGRVSLNGIWVKEVEVAARGCFAIRNIDDDFGAYGFDEIPTVFAFRNEADVPGIVERIRAMQSSERQERIVQAVDAIRKRNDWMTIVHAILETAPLSTTGNGQPVIDLGRHTGSGA